MKRMYVGMAAIVLSVAAFTAFGAQQHPREPAMGMSMMQDCPMHVAGAEVAVADTPGGVALTITTKTGDIKELRRRVGKMSKMHDADEDAPPMHRKMISFAAKYEEVPDGARVILTPKVAEQLEEFRAKVREHVERTKEGECPMMEMMMGGTTQAGPNQQKSDDSNHESHHPSEEVR